jgi:hypothetical protein
MRDPARIDPMLSLIREIWTADPDLRLAQLIVNALRPEEPCPQVFHAEDERLEAGLREYAAMRGAVDSPTIRASDD